jgi:UDP-MurNAc hydroxylase
MPKITFINHASYIVSVDQIRLITDPWMDGYAFNNGWSLIEPTKLDYNDFANITHIWFSHEHPDHFSPSNLRKIPLEFRKEITVLYQETKDKKVISFCKELNFKECIELSDDWFQLSNNFKILNIPHTDGDSWMCIKADQTHILNVNDCVLEDIKQIEEIKQKINALKIDVLFTQFSYANWAGNKEDLATRKAFANKKMQEIERQVNVLQPQYVIPFASYVWFCHAENFYMNDGVNKVDFVHNYINNELKSNAIVLFPNDEWEVNDVHDNQTSINKWLTSYDSRIKLENVSHSDSVLENDLIQSGNEFIRKIKVNNTKWIHFFLKPSHVFITDHRCAYQLSTKGFVKTDFAEDFCDISLGSESMHYCFKFLWGGQLLELMGGIKFRQEGVFTIGNCIFKLLS